MFRLCGCWDVILFTFQIAEAARQAASLGVVQRTFDRRSNMGVSSLHDARHQPHAFGKPTNRERLGLCMAGPFVSILRYISKRHAPFAWG